MSLCAPVADTGAAQVIVRATGLSHRLMFWRLIVPIVNAANRWEKTVIKLLYLLAGISLKQTADEFKSLFQRYIEHMERRRKAVATYVPIEAVHAGTPEAHRTMPLGLASFDEQLTEP